VLVGYADALAAPESVWSLADSGFEVVALAKVGTRPALRWSRSATIRPVTAPGVNAEAAVQDVARLVEELRPVAVLALDDQMVWVHRRLGQRAALPTLPTLPAGDQAELALDKRLQLRLAAKAGLAVPPTDFIDAEQDWPPASQFPLVVKPALAAELTGGRLSRQQAVVCRNAAQLAAARQRLRPPLLVQPLIGGVGEGVFGLATAGAVTAWSGHRRVRMMNPQGSGASACISRPVEPAIREQVADFVAAAGWQGMFMVELLREERGAAWVMELNGRAWGSMALARRRGLAYPAWTVQDALGLPLRPAPPADPPPLMCRHVGRDLLHLAFVARGPATGGTDGSWPKLGAAAREVLSFHRGAQLYNSRPGERMVLLADTAQTLAAQLRKARG
jgi:predicted ATP-grasp superfamily ATP-dependent carboligase